MTKNNVRYSMCWEDPELVLSALNISKKDSVLSIASAGENIFSILLKEPKKLVAIDSNLSQIYLIKLKAAAIKELNFEEFVKFIGLKDSPNRVKYYNKCKKYLSKTEIRFWESNIQSIQKGVIQSGKFEKYLDMFRNYILRFVVKKEDILRYLAMTNLKSQEQFFLEKWNNLRWRLLFKIFFSKAVMQIFGRDKSYFAFNEKPNIANHFYERSKWGITKIPAKSNYFMHMILTGKIPTPFLNHPYLDISNFNKLKKSVNKIEYIHSDLLEFLKQEKASKFSKYNLSDIFEKESQDGYEKTLAEISRTAQKNAIICYWNNLVSRSEHKKVKSVVQETRLSEELHSKERVFFYSCFIVEKKSSIKP